MKYKKYIILILVLAVIFLLFNLLMSRYLKVEREVVGSILSPDGSYDVVIVLSQILWKLDYEVYIAKGSQLWEFRELGLYGDLICHIDCPIDHVRARWGGNNILCIEYDEGSVSSFQSYWGTKKDGGRSVNAVEIRLIQPFMRKLTTDPNLMKEILMTVR